MKVFAHVLGEQFLGEWFTWFSNKPQSACCGSSPEEAIKRLFKIYGIDEFDCSDMISLDEPSKEGFCQFLIAHRHRIVIPMASIN